MPRHTSSITKQLYDVLGGTLEIKLTTEQPRSLAEADHLRAIFAAAAEYVTAHPPESPEVIAERAAQRARLAEWEED